MVSTYTKGISKSYEESIKGKCCQCQNLKEKSHSVSHNVNIKHNNESPFSYNTTYTSNTTHLMWKKTEETDIKRTRRLDMVKK